MHKNLTILSLATLLLCGCFGTGFDKYEPEDGPLVIGGIEIDSLRLCHAIDSIINADHDTLPADKALRSYYAETHQLNWISNDGVTPQADTLLAYIGSVGECGFSKDDFLVDKIADDKLRVDSTDFTEKDVYELVARMDYQMTKSFMRYVGGQRYGFVNPYKVLNRLDRNKHDTVNVVYRQQYDVPTEVIDSEGYRHLAELAGTDSVEYALRDAEPKSALYQRLKQMLPGTDGNRRRQILVNMERCRWRHPHYPTDFSKYVVVNIPSMQLTAVDADSIVEMRIVCGSRDTKTPLVSSNIMRMDLNPKWMVPASVIKHEMAHHAGDSAYFARHRYVITDRKTGDRYNPRQVTREMMETASVRVAQEGGDGNALGRIIFRFANNFSIFLHHTSNVSAFSRADRCLSHGCIRVERPFDLAAFLLEDKDEQRLENIRYTMEYRTPPPSDEEAEKPDRSRILNSVKVSPEIPLFITYYTMYLTPDGTMRDYPDVYSYDTAIYKKLAAFTER